VARSTTCLLTTLISWARCSGDESICPRMTLGFHYFCSDSLSECRYSLLNWLLKSDSFARQPGKFAVSPKVEMDASSEILSGVKLNGAVHSSAAFSSHCVFPRPTPIEWPPLSLSSSRTCSSTILCWKAEQSSRWRRSVTRAQARRCCDLCPRGCTPHIQR
jgi:hypothetical protein